MSLLELPNYKQHLSSYETVFGNVWDLFSPDVKTVCCWVVELRKLKYLLPHFFQGNAVNSVGMSWTNNTKMVTALDFGVSHVTGKKLHIALYAAQQYTVCIMELRQSNSICRAKSTWSFARPYVGLKGSWSGQQLSMQCLIFLVWVASCIMRTQSLFPVKHVAEESYHT